MQHRVKHALFFKCAAGIKFKMIHFWLKNNISHFQHLICNLCWSFNDLQIVLFLCTFCHSALKCLIELRLVLGYLKNPFNAVILHTKICDCGVGWTVWLPVAFIVLMCIFQYILSLSTLPSQCTYVNLRSCNAAAGAFSLKEMSLCATQCRCTADTIHTVAYFLSACFHTATELFSFRFLRVTSHIWQIPVCVLNYQLTCKRAKENIK